MKKIVLFLCVSFATYTLSAQILTPAPSPAAKVTQTVGLTEVTLEYSRPAMRGRVLAGNLIPYDRIWRTGANKNSIITFSKDVMVEGKELKAGSYALFTKPSEALWEIYFYADTENWGTPASWDASKVAAIVKANPVKTSLPVESFTLAITNVLENGAHLEISWGDILVAVPFTVGTDSEVMASIEGVINGPSANDYYSAAVYYLAAGKDIAKAKEWIDKSMSMSKEPAFWQLRQQSLIYAKAGDKKGAIEIAKKSLAGSEAAGNADYVKMNQDSLKEWGSK